MAEIENVLFILRHVQRNTCRVVDICL